MIGSADSRIALVVFAHPDDETLLAGALIAKLIEDGLQVHLLCIAPGDDDDLTARMELAATELGISSVSSLRFAPAGSVRASEGAASSPPLLSAPESVVSSQIAGKMGQLSPGIVITHSPSGDYGHPDHAFCHRVTIAAANEAVPDAAVFALAWSGAMLRLNGMASRAFGWLSMGRTDSGTLMRVDAQTASLRLPVTETHNVTRYLGIRKRAAANYRKELSRGPLPLRMLEAAPIWLQRLALGRVRLSRVE